MKAMDGMWLANIRERPVNRRERPRTGSVGRGGGEHNGILGPPADGLTSLWWRCGVLPPPHRPPVRRGIRVSRPRAINPTWASGTRSNLKREPYGDAPRLRP